MKKIESILVLLAALVPVCQAQEPRETVDAQFSWTSPFKGSQDLIERGGAFGSGKHRDFTPVEPALEIITSRLIKDEVTWEFQTKEGYYLDLFRKGSGDGSERERIFTLTKAIFPALSQILVDVITENNDIKILTADMSSYTVFILKQNPIPLPPAGKHLLVPVSVNSVNWHLDEVVYLQRLGLSFEDGDQNRVIEAIELLSGRSVELRNRQGEVGVIEFVSGIPKRNGVSIQELNRESDRPSAPWGEEDIVAYFSFDDREIIKDRVLGVSGGKDRVFAVLDLIGNQDAAVAIKQEIVASFADSP